MPKFLIEVNYTLEGARGLKSEGGSPRVAAATALIESLGGTVDAFYFALGDTDVYLIADLPDASAVVAAALAVNAGGGATTRTVALLTAADVDAAASAPSTYRPPGS
jgi:uncharacterized protein with GYD domain